MTIDMRRYPDDRPPRLEDFLALIERVLLWKRPLHLRFGPAMYQMNHHPLDRARQGIGWIGWMPFAFGPEDVPEAEIVQPLHGGTLVATQRAYWQVAERSAYYSREAIERAQEVEMRLNLLGVLPTGAELNAGTWGTP